MLTNALTNGTTNTTDPTNTRCLISYLILYKPDTKIARTHLYMEDITEIWEENTPTLLSGGITHGEQTVVLRSFADKYGPAVEMNDDSLIVSACACACAPALLLAPQKPFAPRLLRQQTGQCE